MANRPAQQYVLNSVCAFFGTHLDDLLNNRSRSVSTIWVRQVAAWLLRKYTGMSLNEIGELLNQHHATVIHSIRKVDKVMQDGLPAAPDVLELDKIVLDKGIEVQRSSMPALLTCPHCGGRIGIGDVG